ncbi:MAG: excinuclease ABC subunit UvrC [Clostridia bacterium]|nr:excinuclease ABC subunit UvrC [Clostridia bacterium]
MAQNQDRVKALLEKANGLPLCPGVYIMKNAAGKVIYVGKSRKLKNRVSQYFQNGSKNLKTYRMVSSVDSFDYIVCNTEIEALTLENTLIKQYSPKYNIKLKDAKSYPYIKITHEAYPRLIYTRTRSNDRATYYGPYTGTATVFSILSLLCKTFGIPSCNRRFPEEIGKERPCIYKQMKQCCGVCTGEVSEEEYRELFRSAADILRGNIKETRRELEEKMYAYSEAENYEAAIRYRNTITALDKLSEKQKVVASSKENHDVVGLFEGDVCTGISVLNVRGGVLVNKCDYVFGSDRIVDEDGISTFLCDYYRGKEDIPREILLSAEMEDEEKTLIEEYLSSLVGMRIELRVPERGDKRALCKMAVENAEQAARQYVAEAERSDTVLASLASVLGLEALPLRIEAYDISNLGEEHKTAGMVVCEDGKMKSADYRSFSIRDVDGTDDYACMRETIRRRFAHLNDENGSFSKIPDLILLDGGRGHVSCVRETLAEIGVDVPVFGMVKDEFHKTRALCDETREISIAREQQLFVFIYKIQEEVHRYTVGRMSGAKRKTLKRSSLEAIRGIGPKKARAILLKFGTLAAVKKATADELVQTPGLSRADAEAIVEHFGKQE